MRWGGEAQTEKENQQFLYLDIAFATCVQLYAKSAFDVWMILLMNDMQSNIEWAQLSTKYYFLAYRH